MVRYRYQSEVKAAGSGYTLGSGCLLAYIQTVRAPGLSAPWFLCVGLLFPALCGEVLKQFQVFTEIEECL